jgi:hypothetical protein
MSQPRPIPEQPYRRSAHCEWCIYGLVKWFVCWSPWDSQWELESEICDRCMQRLHEEELMQLCYVWAVEEA